MNLTGFRLGKPFTLDYAQWEGMAAIPSLHIPGPPLKMNNLSELTPR